MGQIKWAAGVLRSLQARCGLGLGRSIARFYRLENPARVGMLRPCF
jgi:hypothetical protein